MRSRLNLKVSRIQQFLVPVADCLDGIGGQCKHLARLKEDLSENGRLQRCDLPRMTPHMEEQLKKKKNKVGFKQYGIADVELLGDFFYRDWEDKVAVKQELFCEWAKFKYNLLGLQSQLPPRDCTSK